MTAGTLMDREIVRFMDRFNLQEKPPEYKCGPRVKLTKRQATSRPDHLWPEIWRSMSRNGNEAETTLGS